MSNPTSHSSNTGFIMDAETPWDDLGGGVMRQVMGYNDDLMLVKFKFKKGGVGALHHHIHSQGAVIVSGVFELTIDGQKKILIGDKGERIKLVGQQARIDMEKLFDTKIMLKLWVKVKSGWSDDERAIKSLGYNDF